MFQFKTKTGIKIQDLHMGYTYLVLVKQASSTSNKFEVLQLLQYCT